MTETELDTPVEEPEPLPEPLTEPEMPEDEEPEEEPEEDEETPEEPSQEDLASPQTEKEIEQAIRKLEKHQETNYNRIVAILGDAADDLAPCALCNHPALGQGRTPGWRAETIPNEVVVQRVRAAIGLVDTSDFRKSSSSRRCDECNGKGRTRTESDVSGMELEQCDRCRGRGFIKVGGPTDIPPAVIYTNGGDLPVPAPIEETVTTDPWGRDPTDPLFGVMPNLVAQRQAVQ